MASNSSNYGLEAPYLSVLPRSSFHHQYPRVPTHAMKCISPCFGHDSLLILLPYQNAQPRLLVRPEVPSHCRFSNSSFFSNSIFHPRRQPSTHNTLRPPKLATSPSTLYPSIADPPCVTQGSNSRTPPRLYPQSQLVNNPSFPNIKHCPR